MIRRYSKYVILVVVLTIPLLLNGCWDYSDVDKRSIVVSIGIDKVKNNIELSGEISKMAPDGGRGEQVSTRNVYTDISYGENFEEARMEFSSKHSYETFLGATQVVLFGKNFAREGIESYINRINNTYDYRKNLLPVITREPPSEILNVNTQDDFSAGSFISNNLQNLSDEGIAIKKTVGEVVSDISAKDLGYVLPYIGADKGEIRYLGMAIMKDSKLIDIVGLKDSSGFLYIMSKNVREEKAVSSQKNPGNKLSFLNQIDDRDIRVKKIDDKVVINVNLNIDAYLIYQYYNQYLNEKEMIVYGEILSKEIKNNIVKSIKRTQSYNCDVFGFANYFRACDAENYMGTDWNEEYSKAEVVVNVKTKILNNRSSNYAQDEVKEKARK